MTTNREPIAHEASDAALWSHTRSGSEDAFEALYSRHVRAVSSYLSRRLPLQEVDDVTASVFLEAWTQRSRVVVDEQNGLLPWLLGVARNLAKSHYRQAARTPIPAQEAVVEGSRIATLGSDAGADVAILVENAERETNELAAAVAALASLSDRDQEVLDLVLIAGLSPGAAARQLGINAVTLRSRLHRSRARLAAAFAREIDAGSRPPSAPPASTHRSTP